MRARAGIVVTGTEVLTGRVADANGSWLAEELRRLGVDVGQVVVVGDRAADLLAALRFLAASHDLVITTGGLGPTADDLTAAVVADFQARPLAPDVALQTRIQRIVERLYADRGWDSPAAEVRAGTAKQALVPRGARVLEPTGTAPGLVVPAPDGHDGPPVLVLPGPPRELRAMWPAALAAPEVAAALAGAVTLHEETIRIWGPPEAELAGLLRDHEARHGLDDLEVSTCLRDGELEVVTRFAPEAAAAYRSLTAALVDRFGARVFSTDGRTVDRVLADLLVARGATVATAESCTAGLVAGRLADLPGSSRYLLGGFVTYANEAKTAEVGVPEQLLRQVGAVSEEVAVAMAAGARERLGTTYGLSTTGVAGPDGGTPEKPVGLVHVAVVSQDGVRHRALRLGGGRDAIRARSVTSLLHLLREVVSAGPPGAHSVR
ncbi:competence/damage-inducible protein A [Nocardioides sp. GY 10113]|uniref:competence/damage-inducible protein A n=1 Tax=Nocardioides sp. GY 10113 TaxID=2569761 RepID=UPI0010A79A6C|nr:competence/damage-inducible protein A [Nocardioides sp. GY 10113]TIC87642.1 competence/damage-inducible protein A [Nocardioides sp. GY 10113]